VTIATASRSGEPWNSPVFSAFDARYRFFWASDQQAQHSRNIAENPLVFLVIYDSTVPALAGEGVYVRARATPLTDREEVREALAHLAGRIGEEPASPDQFLAEMPRRVYRATPERMWRNADGERNGQFVDVRREVDLEALRGHTAARL
jgi:hypothetical protein